MAAARQNRIPASRLSQAVDSVLNSPEGDVGEAEALLRQYAAAALRHILERQDPALLAAAIRQGLFSRERAGRVAAEQPNLGCGCGCCWSTRSWRRTCPLPGPRRRPLPPTRHRRLKRLWSAGSSTWE